MQNGFLVTALMLRLSTFLPPQVPNVETDSSVDTSNPAIYRHRKPGHLGSAVETV